MEFDEFDHESHMRRAFELAEKAAERGDRPFGSVLVRDDQIIAEESNRVVTEDDIRRHPELHLAYRACEEYDRDQRRRTVMYTSTEPCPMCAGGLRHAELGRITYSVSGDEIVEFTGGDPLTRSARILDTTEVTGPVLNERGRQLHHDFW